MLPTIGRIVLYVLTEEDVKQINHRRTSGSAIADRIKNNGAYLNELTNIPETWPLGAQAHIGNYASSGEQYPCVVVRVWLDEFGPGLPGINGQVLMDGSDQFWVTSVGEESHPYGEVPTPGKWRWPVKV
jgi:hypothetical protein